MYKEVIYIVLGWLFGILSPSIVKKVSEKSEKESLRKIFSNDLKDLKKRLAPLSYSVYSRYGMLTKEHFEWLKKNCEDINFSEGFNKIKESGIDEENLVSLINTNGMNEDTLWYFKKMHLFVVDSHMTNFGLIDSSTMEKILEIRFHVEAFNEEIDSYREHLKMTFLPGVSVGNHEIISRGLKSKSINIAKQSVFIVDKINNVQS